MPEHETADARVMLAEALFNDAEARPVMEDLIAKKFPKAAPTIPGYNARKSIEARIAELDKKLDEDKREREAERAKREAEQEWSAARDIAGLNDEDRGDVEKIMSERRTANFEDAANRLAASRRVAAPRADVRGMQIPGVKGAGGDWFKGIVEDPETWARDKAEQVVADFHAGKGHLHT